MDNQQRLDLLSDLPLDIIHMILSLVPFKEAVRISLLSKQWRFAWVSLPYLQFDDDDDDKVISHALRRHKGPILRFEMSYSRKITFPELNEWILCLSRKGIRELYFNLYGCDWYNYQFHELRSLYECSKLNHLELSYVKLCPPPSTFMGFPFLRCLCLQYCELSDQVQTLLVNSPLLERLTLDHYSESPKLKINLPYLKYLYLGGFWEEIFLCAPLLTELHAEMDEEDWYYYKSPHYHLCNFTDLGKLSGNGYLIEILRTVMESSNRTLVFSRLKEIVLNSVDFEDIKEMSVVARLLIGAPNLHKLSINASGYDSSFASLLKDFVGCEANFTFKKLRVVTIRNYRFQMQLLKFLIGSSPVLETMDIQTINKLVFESSQDYTNLKDAIPEFRRAFPNAKIFLNYGLVVD